MNKKHKLLNNKNLLNFKLLMKKINLKLLKLKIGY